MVRGAFCGSVVNTAPTFAWRSRRTRTIPPAIGAIGQTLPAYRLDNEFPMMP
jgi:hypothetical protein